MNYIGLINGIIETVASIITTVFTLIGEEMIVINKKIIFPEKMNFSHLIYTK